MFTGKSYRQASLKSKMNEVIFGILNIQIGVLHGFSLFL